MEPGSGLIYVVWGRATVGLVVRAAVVVDAPPYARRLGWLGRDARALWRELYRRVDELAWVPAR